MFQVFVKSIIRKSLSAEVNNESLRIHRQDRKAHRACDSNYRHTSLTFEDNDLPSSVCSRLNHPVWLVV